MPALSPRIAIVDDDDAVLESTRFLLEISGHAVATFTSAVDFLASADSRAYDRLILDHHMPRLTGLELARHLREAGVRIPTMLLTGSLTPDIITRAGELGLERVVEKPASEADLMAFVEAAA